MSTEPEYADAVGKLNSLQSNAAIIESVRKSRGALNMRSIPEMHEFLERLGYKVCGTRTASEPNRRLF